MNKKITIIGGGISGITTALVLQLLGYRTILFTEYLADGRAPEDPRFASLYPAASVIPHSVTSGRMDVLFPPSQELFKTLLEKEFPGMRLHKHFELFEFPQESPEYSSSMPNFRRIEDMPGQQIPRRPGTGELHGWVFDCYVTEWPLYLHHLYDLYPRYGGEIRRQKISKADLKTMDSELVVNCTGVWSPDLFNDPEPRRVARGHLVQFGEGRLIRDGNNNIPSYNYTPRAHTYPDPEGNPTDVYFYPRSTGWILGGSRQKGVLSDDGTFCGPEPAETVSVAGRDIPSRIMKLNRDIILHTYGMDIDDFPEPDVRVGYRYVRNFNGNGLRLEAVEEYGKTVIHNYGHGGAGVTISWGCALEVARMVGENTTHPQDMSGELFALLKKKLQLIDFRR